MIGFLSLEDHAKFLEQKEGTTNFLSNIRIKIGSLHPQKVGSKLDRSSHPLFERWHRPGFSEVVGRKGKQWWVKLTLSWTYDRNRNQGKGSTMKQYLVVEVCRRGIDAASLYISIEAKHDVYIYIYPATTIFKTHTNHHSWCQLDTKRKDPYFLLAGHPLFRPTLPKDTYDNDTSQISLPYTILYVNYMMPFQPENHSNHVKFKGNPPVFNLSEKPNA